MDMPIIFMEVEV